jgi:hypothetical protein
MGLTANAHDLDRAIIYQSCIKTGWEFIAIFELFAWPNVDSDQAHLLYTDLQ